MANQELSVIDAAARLVAAILAAAPAGLDTESYVRQTARAAVTSALKAHELEKGAHDGRARSWRVTAEFWVAAVPGAPVDLQLLAGSSTAAGMIGVATWLRDGAAYAFRHHGGLPDACTLPALHDRLVNLRVAISRGGGAANMRHAIVTRDGRQGWLRATVTRGE